MTLTTYAGLSTGVFRRLDRTADSAVFDDCISLAEAEINRRLALKPVRPMHIRSTATVNAQYIAVPTGILDVDSFKLDDSATEPLTFTSPQNMEAMYAQNDETGVPDFYTQIGTEFRFYPEPDASYTATLIYWTKVPALTSVATTNWLSLAHPDVYFHGILAHAYQEYFDPENADVQAGLFDVAIQKVLDAYPHRTDTRPLRSEISQYDLGSRYSGVLA